jgi:hypothetical protein
MQTSRFLARLIGPLLITIGVGFLINGDIYMTMAGQFLQSFALIYVSGLLALVGGLAIVNTHNVWIGDWRIVITILGWAAVVGGVLRIVFPQWVEQIGTTMLSNRGAVTGAWIVLLLLGIWLSYAGYFEESRAASNVGKRAARKR